MSSLNVKSPKSCDSDVQCKYISGVAKIVNFYKTDNVFFYLYSNLSYLKINTNPLQDSSARKHPFPIRTQLGSV